MPGVKRKYAKKSKSSRAKTRRRFNKFSSRTRVRKAFPMYSSLPGLAPSRIVYMPYSGEHLTGGAALTYQIYRSNSIYDPDYTGTGHQPRSHDQYALYYRYYRVLGCKIKVTAFWQDGAGKTTYVGLFADSDVTTYYTNPQDLFEKYGNRRARILLGTMQSKVSMSLSVPISKLTAGALKDQRTVFGANPTLDGPFINIWWVPTDLSATTTYPRIHAQLVYKVLLTEPIDISGS